MTAAAGTSLFDPGRIYSTPAARQAAAQEMLERCLRRHLSGDWGEIPSIDARGNDDAVRCGNRRIISFYGTGSPAVCVMTESDHGTTIIMRAAEYSGDENYEQ